MKLSICIPSYNRGHRAYPLIKDLLELKCPVGDELEIVLSNNGSDKNVEGYNKLKELVDERFHYYEYDINMRFWCNYNQVIQKSTGDWCVILSDEDNILQEGLEYYFTVIKQNPSLGIVKAAGGVYSFENSKYCIKGREAISEYFMKGNYISGTMYNRKIVSDLLIQLLAEDYSADNIAYYYYPHLFVDLYAMILGDYFQGKERLILKGEGINDQEKSDSRLFSQAAYTTYESRLLQMDGFVKMISDLDTSEAIKFKCFKILIDKYMLLLQNSRTNMRQQAERFMVDEIKKTNSAAIISKEDDFTEYICLLAEEML